jgi:hypothetical protein
MCRDKRAVAGMADDIYLVSRFVLSALSAISICDGELLASALNTDARLLDVLGLGQCANSDCSINSLENGPLGTLWPAGVPLWYQEAEAPARRYGPSDWFREQARPDRFPYNILRFGSP